MFHWQNNIFFGRKSDGAVRVLKVYLPPEEYPTPDGAYPGAEIDLTIPANHWGSIVASVSQGGEAKGRWHQAMEFHNGDPAPSEDSGTYGK